MIGNSRENPAKTPIEIDMETIRSISHEIEAILVQEGIGKDEIRRRVMDLLIERRVPFIEIDIEKEEKRTDGKDFCIVKVHVPESWPRGSGGKGQYFFISSVPSEK